MKRTSRVLALVCATVLLICALGACGKKAPAAEGDGTTPPAAATKTYVIYSDNAFAPFEYYDTAAGVYVGVDMDILAAIAENQGFSYEVKNEGFDASQGAVQSGQADAMIAGMSITDERKQTYDFSDGYYKNGQILVVPTNSTITKVDDLKGAVVAVKTGTMGATYAEEVREQYGFTLQYYEDSPTMYTAVVNGTNVACFEDFAVVSYAVDTEKLALKTVGDQIKPAEYGFAVKKGSNPELIKMFNDGLKNIKDNGKYDEILAKYGL